MNAFCTVLFDFLIELASQKAPTPRALGAPPRIPVKWKPDCLPKMEIEPESRIGKAPKDSENLN